MTIIAFFLACLLGLGIAVASRAESKAIRQCARFYVEFIRGIPILVLLFYVAFVGAPALVAAYNTLASPLIERGLLPSLLVRDFSLLSRAVIALTIAYSAFIAEIFRAESSPFRPARSRRPRHWASAASIAFGSSSCAGLENSLSSALERFRIHGQG